MKVLASLVSIALIVFLPAVYSQSTCGTVCCDYDYKASNESCCKYWVCVNGVETEMVCPGGLHWNEAAKACDWVESANCDGGIVVTEPPDTTTEEVTTTPEDITTTPEDITTTPEDVTTTPGDITTTPGEITTTPEGCGSVCECTSGEYQPIVGEACKYQTCDNGKWTTMTCPGGLVWNDSLKGCAWLACDTCGECTPGQYEAVDGEACKFKVCEHGSWTTMSCPSGSTWDNAQKACAGVYCDGCTVSSV